MKLLTIFAALAAFSGGTFASQRDLLTVIQYGGGFKQDVMGDVTSKDLVSEFRVAIPAFCQGVEVLEAATYSEGVKDIAVLKDSAKLIYSVRGGTPMRIGKVSLTLNGPASAACAIPVLVNENSGGGVHTGTLVANEHISLCTDRHRAVSVVTAFQVDGRWRVQGWHTIPAHSCITPMTKGRLEGRIYTHGVLPGLISVIWGSERPFCVRSGMHFNVWDDECFNYSGVSRPLFSGHDIDPEVKTTLRFN